jgi:hypothetical protein
MQIDKLSDFQLYSLVINQDLNTDMHRQAEAEFKKRHFSQEYIDKLSLEYENIISIKNGDITVGEKLRIIAFPFIIPMQAIIANKYISKSPQKWKLYWKYLTIGWAVWTIVLFLAIRLLFK